MQIRYGAWSGTQDPFPAEVGVDEVLGALSDDLLGGMTVDEAMDRLLRRGMRGEGRLPGLDELRRRVEQARRAELARMGLEGPLRRIAEELEAILERERTALEFDATGAAPARQEQLDALPPDVAGRLAALRDYEWVDPRAGADFRALLDRLRQEVARATFGRVAEALGSMTPQDLGRMAAFLRDLNDLVERRERGEDVNDAFAAFKQRHADLLPGDPGTLDELLGDLARRMAAMSRLLAGLDGDQQRQLAALAEQVLGGDGPLAAEAARLQRSLERRFPELGWDRAFPGAMPAGDVEGSLADTVDWLEHLQQHEDLARALRQDYPGARLEDVDESALREIAGDDAARALRALREIERALEEAGAARRRGGRLELTPRGIRKLGERALARIFSRAMDGGAGSHQVPVTGGDGELTGTSRPWAFGDPFRLDIPRTVRNTVLREAQTRHHPGRRSGGAGIRPGVGIRPGDLELAEAERRVRAVTVLLLDMSFSMPLRGNWGPAKRVALALHALVASKFPEDRLHVVGFSDYARRLRSQDLLLTGWEHVYGTNMQHAFLLTRRLLGAHPGAEAQVIMITDGEPTAHLEGSQAFFNWPPAPKTLRLTLAEAARLARTGATLNVFLLDHDPGAAVFVERMVRSVGGRIFHPDLDDLGHLVVQDFLDRRRASPRP